MDMPVALAAPIALALPVVSIVMPNYNGGRFIAAAIRSVLAQTLTRLELIVIDDASTDGSLGLVEAMATRDPRIRLLRSEVNTGPAGARNRGLDAACGRWVAVVDNDDLLHPERLALLVAAAEANGADIAADGLLVFQDDHATPPVLLMPCAASRPFRQIELPEYIRSNALRPGPGMPLGYLKPIFRAAMLHETGVRYDTSLRNAEDYDLVARLLLAGCVFLTFPLVTYFYRRHPSSTSHRLDAQLLAALAVNSDAFRAAVPPTLPQIRQAAGFRSRTIRAALAEHALVTAIKHRHWTDAVRVAARSPMALRVLAAPVLNRLSRAGRRPAAETAGIDVCVLSRQRIVGNTNGSSAYLLSLCGALRSAGARVHLVCPSASMFGRWPWLRLQPEMAVFASIEIRGGLRIGQVILALDLLVLARAGLTVLDRLLARAGIGHGNHVKPAPYAIAAPWTAEDSLFVARHAAKHAGAILADYAFLTEAIPYVLRPDAPSAVVMHDMFSNRAAAFAEATTADSVASLDVATEMAMLSRAGAVIAIQAAEGSQVRACLPMARVIVAPMPAKVHGAAQPGDGATLLFVGSNTAPNIDGLRWFLDAILPIVHAANPAVRLQVAGTVSQAFRQPQPGVIFLGRVADLAPLYRDAAVVISPLRAGSGLKIKLIEALGQGKAVVVTPVTLQGVETQAGEAVLVAAEAGPFAATILSLLPDPGLRRKLGEAALDAARRHFSIDACFAETVAYLLDTACIQKQLDLETTRAMTPAH